MFNAPHPIAILSALAATANFALAAGAPLRGWECVPGVIRDNGVDTFHIEVFAGEPVESVVLEGLSPFFTGPAGGIIPFRDDGQAGDRTAGDNIHTAGPFALKAGALPALRFWNDPDNPDGLDILDVGQVRFQYPNSTTSSFLIQPSVGVFQSVPPTPGITRLSEAIIHTRFLVNIRSEARHTQRTLRNAGGDLAQLTSSILQTLPDQAHFFVFISTHHVEYIPATTPDNFISGRHQLVRLDFTGMGRGPFDDSARFGSKRTLLGVVALDVGKRGLYSAGLTHELLHQWTPGPAAGLTDADEHYSPRGNIGSLLGGFRWITGADGITRIDCTEGRNGAHRASALDRYMMGLIEPALVPAIQTYGPGDPPPHQRCGQPPGDDVLTRTLPQIIGLTGVGPRQPGPDMTPRRFNLIFVAETHGRLLTPTELAFYDRLAEHFTSPAAADDPPYIGFNWAPISVFFGPEAQWSTVPLPVADFDADGDVDFADLVYFQNCASGPRILHPPGCEDADLDGDGDVDQSDFGVFQMRWTGTQ